MPIYDYRCAACGNQVEVMHAIDASGPTECAVCGGAMRKALSPPAIHFKGSGWAKKDARSAARTAKPESGSKDVTASDKTATDHGGSSEVKASTSKETSGSSGGATAASTSGSAKD